MLQIDKKDKKKQRAMNIAQDCVINLNSLHNSNLFTNKYPAELQETFKNPKRISLAKNAEAFFAKHGNFNF